MKYRIWLSIAFFLCVLPLIGQNSAKAKHVSVSNYEYTPAWIRKVIDQDKLLSLNEKEILEQKIDSIYRESKISISIFIFANAEFGKKASSKHFAAAIHKLWHGIYKYGKAIDKSLIIVYDKQHQDFGYYHNRSIDNWISSPLKHLYKSPDLQSQNKKDSGYTAFLKFLTEIDDFFLKTKEAEQEAIKQQQIEEEEKQIAMAKYADKRAIGIHGATLLGLLVWIRRKEIVAQTEFDFYEDASAFLKNSILKLYGFVLILYIPTLYILSELIGDINFDYIFFIVLGFMLSSYLFGQWRLNQLKKKLISRTNSFTKQPVSQQSIQSLSNNGGNQTTNKIDINTATAEQIRKLSNLLTAVDVAKIIREREENGYFKSINDLQTRMKFPSPLIREIEQNAYFSTSDDTPSGKDKRKGKRVLDI